MKLVGTVVIAVVVAAVVAFFASIPGKAVYDKYWQYENTATTKPSAVLPGGGHVNMSSPVVEFVPGSATAVPDNATHVQTIQTVPVALVKETQIIREFAPIGVNVSVAPAVTQPAEKEGALGKQ